MGLALEESEKNPLDLHPKRIEISVYFPHSPYVPLFLTGFTFFDQWHRHANTLAHTVSAKMIEVRSA